MARRVGVVHTPGVDKSAEIKVTCVQLTRVLSTRHLRAIKVQTHVSDPQYKAIQQIAQVIFSIVAFITFRFAGTDNTICTKIKFTSSNCWDLEVSNSVQNAELKVVRLMKFFCY